MVVVQLPLVAAVVRRCGDRANGGWVGHHRPKPPAPFKILEKAGADKSRVTFTVGSGLGTAFF